MTFNEKIHAEYKEWSGLDVFSSGSYVYHTKEYVYWLESKSFALELELERRAALAEGQKPAHNTQRVQSSCSIL